MIMSKLLTQQQALIGIVFVWACEIIVSAWFYPSGNSDRQTVERVQYSDWLTDTDTIQYVHIQQMAAVTWSRLVVVLKQSGPCCSMRLRQWSSRSSGKYLSKRKKVVAIKLVFCTRVEPSQQSRIDFINFDIEINVYCRWLCHPRKRKLKNPRRYWEDLVLLSSVG